MTEVELRISESFKEIVEMFGQLVERFVRNRFRPGTLQEAIVLSWWKDLDFRTSDNETVVEETSSPRTHASKLAILEERLQAMGLCEDLIDLVKSTIQGNLLFHWLRHTCSSLKHLSESPHRDPE